MRAGDALAGAVDRGPFDRVISTVAVPHVPQAWLEQTTPGAVLVVPLILAGHGGIMARLERTDQASASGTLLPDYGGFMATRQSPMPELPILRLDHIDHAQPSDLPIAALRDDHLAADFLALTAPPFKLVGFTPDDRSTGPQTWGRGLDGSQFVAFERDGHTHVATEGPLWSHLSEAYRRWQDHGRPDRTLVHLTVTATGRHQLWLDAPATVLREWGA